MVKDIARDLMRPGCSLHQSHLALSIAEAPDVGGGGGGDTFGHRRPPRRNQCARQQMRSAKI
eukprot:1879249-Lingulodinium_polyedra.AAC.1